MALSPAFWYAVPGGRSPSGWYTMTGYAGGPSRARRDLEQIRREKRTARRGRYLRGVGYVTRRAVYVGPIVFLAWALWSYRAVLGQSLESLTAIDLVLLGGCVVGVFGIVISAMLFFFNVDGEPTDWEDWGRVGLGLVVVAVVGAFWLTLP